MSWAIARSDAVAAPAQQNTTQKTTSRASAPVASRHGLLATQRSPRPPAMSEQAALQHLVRRLALPNPDKAAAVVAKALEYVRVSTARLGAGGLGQVSAPGLPPPGCCRLLRAARCRVELPVGLLLPSPSAHAGLAHHTHPTVPPVRPPGRAVQGCGVRGAGVPDARCHSQRLAGAAPQRGGRQALQQHQGHAAKGAQRGHQGLAPRAVHPGAAPAPPAQHAVLVPSGPCQTAAFAHWNRTAHHCCPSPPLAQFGCTRHEPSVRACLAAYKERFARSLPPAQQRHVDFTRAAFLAAAFYCVARKHKVSVSDDAQRRRAGQQAGIANKRQRGRPERRR